MMMVIKIKCIFFLIVKMAISFGRSVPLLVLVWAVYKMTGQNWQC